MQCNFVISVRVDSFVCDHFSINTSAGTGFNSPRCTWGAGAFGRISPLWAALLD